MDTADVKEECSTIFLFFPNESDPIKEDSFLRTEAEEAVLHNSLGLRLSHT